MGVDEKIKEELDKLRKEAKKAIEANPSMPLLLNPGYVEYAERLEELRKEGEITLREYDRRRKEMFDFYNKVSEKL
ncbi:MAG: hypothetical protein J7L59_01225 [Nanoarchaeota archaeon]|nr:hypothetical protein [Nanoarchaeota archaeon]